MVAIEFAGGVTATFTMTAFTDNALRRTQIFGTAGSSMVTASSCGSSTSHRRHRGDRYRDRWRERGEGHAGGDAGLIAAFVGAVATGDASLIASGPAESLETHLAVFAAEHARHAGTVETVTA